MITVQTVLRAAGVLTLATITAGAGYGYGKGAGFMEGFRAYHQLCSEGDKMMLDKDVGTVVQCYPLGTLPQVQEDPLDKKQKM